MSILPERNGRTNYELRDRNEADCDSPGGRLWNGSFPRQQPLSDTVDVQNLRGWQS
jgi:hypothetical protein